MSLPLFGVLVGVATLTTIQFYRGRRRNLELLKQAVDVLEETLKPVDKEYVLIGLYVGYTAYYTLDKGLAKKAAITVTVLPRQSLLYLPFSLLLRRHDRIVFVYELEIPGRKEAHLVRKGYYRLGAKHAIGARASEMLHEKMRLGDKKYDAFYTTGSQRLLDTLKQYVERIGPKYVGHIAAIPKPPRFYLSAKLPHNPQTLRRMAMLSLEAANKIAMML